MTKTILTLAALAVFSGNAFATVLSSRYIYGDASVAPAIGAPVASPATGTYN